MIVVDTNAVVALVLHTEATEAARRWRLTEPQWAAPRLLLAELCNVLLGEVRRNRLTLEHATRIAETVDELLEWLPDPPPSELLAAAAVGGLTAYDAVFVAAALRAQARLLTADKAILVAFPAVATAL